MLLESVEGPDHSTVCSTLIQAISRALRSCQPSSFSPTLKPWCEIQPDVHIGWQQASSMLPQLVSTHVDSFIDRLVSIEKAHEHTLHNVRPLLHNMHGKIDNENYLTRSEFIIFAIPIVTFMILLVIALSLISTLLCLFDVRKKLEPPPLPAH